jgi:3-oxoacyl-[acyl-carrier protein] reductase
MRQAIVIGGSAGIGQCIVEALVQADFHVLLTYHSGAEKAQALCARLGESSCRAEALDLSSLDAVDAFLARREAEPPPEVLVNCAGVPEDGLSLGDIRARLSYVTTVNYLAPAIISGRLASVMAPQRRGFVVNITSAAARRPRAGNAAYGSSKAALERFTATLALELARFKVRTLCIAPAFVDTAMFRKFAGDKANEFIRDNIPMREILRPEDVAQAVLGFVRGTIKTTGTTLTLASGEITF